MIPVKDFEGLYSVTLCGRVWSHISNRWLSPAKGYWGYRTVGLCKNGKVSRRTVHRLVAQAFIPNPEKLATVDHIDGNKENNSVSNLQWLSVEDNIRKTSAKEFTFVSPDGDVRAIINLSKFCRENGLSRAVMSCVNSGKILKYKGWTKYDKQQARVQTAA